MQMSKEHVVELLEEFDRLNGISGFEDEVAKKLCERLAPFAPDQSVDRMGNCICIKKGKNPDFKIMLSAHMDEIGLMVHEILDNGYIQFVPIGMHNPNMLVNQVMTIHTKKGKVFGVVGGGKPIHQEHNTNNTGFGFKDLRLDVGAVNQEEARQMGIKIGDVINIEREPRLLNGSFFSGKAVDNRSGCVAMILIMELLKDVETEASIYCCGTTQEEVGIKGAKVVSRSVKPDIALALDVGIGAEDEKLNPNGTRTYLGKGPGIQMYDWNPSTFLGVIVPRKLTDALEDAANKAGVIYQKQVVLSCGTDATEISLSNDGVITGGLAIPNRYIHTSIGVIHIDDVIGVAKVAAEFIKDITAEFLC